MGYVCMHIWWFQKIDVEMTNCHLLNQYKWFTLIFIDFRIPKPFVSVFELPAALRRPQKKHALDFVSMYFICFVICKRFQCPLVKKIQMWPIWSNDYARKTRIEIQCKKTCSTAPNRFSKSHLLGNSCEYRTFARMSTWAIGLINIHAQSD